MQDKVNGPGIALMVIGGLTILYAFVSIPLNLMNLRNNPQIDQMGAGVMYAIIAVAVLILLAVGVTILMGGMKMRALQNKTLVTVASILAMIPCCVGLCCVPGLPIGIWSLVVMNDPQVKAAFTS